MTRDLVDLLGGPADVAAPALLGHLITAHGVTLRLTEVEAYAADGDPASHAYRRRTARNASMYGPPGTLYVYFSYGMHWCINVGCGPVGVARAVLLRAAEVVDGHGVARERRPGAAERDLARGPARLSRVLAIDRAADGSSLLDGRGPLTIAPPTPGTSGVVRSGPRVGVSLAADTPWRFWLDGEPTVSPYRRSPRAPALGADPRVEPPRLPRTR